MNLESNELKSLLESIRYVYGYDFTDYAEASVKRRVLHFMSTRQISRLDDLGKILLRDEKLFEELLSNAENARSTYHEKIMIADVRQYDFDLVEKRVNKLISSARQHYTLETVFLMKELVPEFVSNNVAYEKVNLRTPNP